MIKLRDFAPWLIIFLYFFLLALFVRFVGLSVLSLYIPVVRKGLIADFVWCISMGLGFTFMTWFVCWLGKRFKGQR